VFSGFDHHLLNTLQLGEDGTISASGNFAPHLSVVVYNAFINRDLEKAVTVNKQKDLLGTQVLILGTKSGIYILCS
jgi:2-dehydro-3-deoxy-D-pentonate aldolase